MAPIWRDIYRTWNRSTETAQDQWGTAPPSYWQQVKALILTGNAEGKVYQNIWLAHPRVTLTNLTYRACNQYHLAYWLFGWLDVWLVGSWCIFVKEPS